MGRIRLFIALMLAISAAPASAEYISLYPQGAGPLTFSASALDVGFVQGGTFLQDPSFTINFDDVRWTLPGLGVLGLTGRLDAIEIGTNSIAAFRITHDFKGVEPADSTIPPSWQIHGLYTFSGTVKVVAGGVTVASDPVSAVQFLGCGSSTSTMCVMEGMTFNSSIIATLLEPDIPLPEILFENFKLVGSLIDDRGTFHSSDHIAEFSMIEPLYVIYEYTPLSEVPLPGAFWLFGSALLGIALAINRRARAPDAR